MIHARLGELGLDFGTFAFLFGWERLWWCLVLLWLTHIFSFSELLILLLLLDDVVGRFLLTKLQYGVLGRVAAFFGRLCKVNEGSDLMVLGVLETKSLLTAALCHSLVGIDWLRIVDNKSLVTIGLGISLRASRTKYSSLLMINANATDEVTLRPSELCLIFRLLFMLLILARVQIVSTYGQSIAVKILPGTDVGTIRRIWTTFAVATTLSSKVERFALEQLLLVPLSLQLSILFSLQLLDLIFLELLQHVAECAVHLRNCSIEAPDDAPRTQGLYACLRAEHALRFFLLNVLAIATLCRVLLGAPRRRRIRLRIGLSFKWLAENFHLLWILARSLLIVDVGCALDTFQGSVRAFASGQILITPKPSNWICLCRFI